jgi:signal transduction histidine kinase
VPRLTDELRLRDFTGTDAIRVAVLAVVYIVAARLGLELDAVSGFATLVWPASGIALAALVIFGIRLWPGILIGAFTANTLVGAPVPVAIGIGIGNTLSAIVGAYLLRRIPGFNPSLSRVRDTLGLIVGAAVVSTLVSATIGVGSLVLGNRIPDGSGLETWRAWWLGDAIGDLLVAPLLLVSARRPRLPTGARLVEAIALGATTIAVGLVVFHGSREYGALTAYLIFPVGIWAALRFGPRGAAATILLASAGAVWATTLGHGPFVRDQLVDSLFALQFFTSVVAVTLLVLAAAIAERRCAEEGARQAQRLADEANRSKSEFLAVMSHELRTPLHAIAGYSELLTLGAHGALNEKQIESIARIQRNQQHLNALIGDVLSFARLEAGKLEFDPVVLGVNEALDEVEPLILPELRRKNLCFERQSCPPGLRVRADREKLRQILLNFLSNAAKYTENGGDIAIGVEASANSATIWVKDSGIGIPPEQLARVFEPFFQVERGRTRRFSGIGLGLTIARDLARAMGGDVSIESVPDQGTRVAVRLPTA